MELGSRLYALDLLPDWWTNKELVDSKKGLTHRYMSNNSILFKSKPKKEYLQLIFDLMRDTGEPGFVNIESANKRRPNAKGVNPLN